jgi:hypothetical protein
VTTSRLVAGLLAAAWPFVVYAQGGGGSHVQLQTERTVLEFEAGDLTPEEAQAFSRLLDQGVLDLESLIGQSLPAGPRRPGRIRYVVSTRAPMSRTYGHTVVLPLDRVKGRSAPYLHETVHALIPSRGENIWLSEGLASYLESWVSENRGGYDAHVFTRAGDRGIHAAARRYLGSEMGRAVLPWVGADGEPPRLEEDRSRVARPFYVLSQSFTKYLVDSAGLDAVIRFLVSADSPAFTRASGRSCEHWKSDWLRTIGAQTAGPPPRSGPPDSDARDTPRN